MSVIIRHPKARVMLPLYVNQLAMTRWKMLKSTYNVMYLVIS